MANPQQCKKKTRHSKFILVPRFLRVQANYMDLCGTSIPCRHICQQPFASAICIFRSVICAHIDCCWALVPDLSCAAAYFFAVSKFAFRANWSLFFRAKQAIQVLSLTGSAWFLEWQVVLLA